MADKKGKHVAPPRPNKNSDGQAKQPTPAPRPPVAPGSTNPMTHPSAPGMQPPAAPATPNGSPPGAGMQHQSRQLINVKDLPPPMQMQAEQQQGMDPMAPLKMLQSNVLNTVGQGPTPDGGAVPNQLSGPGVPPDVASFPDDMAHLHALMQQGLGPGASPQEHSLGQNAHAIARAHEQQAQMHAQNDTQQQAAVAHLGGLLHHLGSTGQLPDPADVAAHVAGLQGQQQPGGVPPGYGTGIPQEGPPAAPPQLGATLNQPPPPAPGGPQGPQVPQVPGGPPLTPDGQIPPNVIADLMKAKRRPPGR